MVAVATLTPRQAGASRAAPDLSPVELVLARVRSLARRRMTWLEHTSDVERTGASARSAVDAVLLDRDDPRAEEEFYAESPALTALNSEIAEYTSLLDADTASRLFMLSRAFGLSTAERDVLHVCLAFELDPSLGVIFSRLSGSSGRPYVTAPLAMRLTGRGRTPLPSGAQPLFSWGLVRIGDAAPGEPPALTADPHIVDYVCDRLTTDPELVGRVSELSPQEPLASWPIVETANAVRRALAQGRAVRVAVLGPPSCGRRTFAACITNALGSSAIAVDTKGASDDEWRRVHLRAQRQAILFGMALVWHGDRVGQRTPPTPGLVPLEFLIGDVDLAVSAEDGVIDERVVLRQPLVDERRMLWLRFVPESRSWPPGDLDHLVERYRISVGDIAIAAGRGAIGAREAAELCRQATRHRLGDLAELVDCSFDRGDLVLPEQLEATLDDFLFEARERVRYWENSGPRRLFPRGRGLVALMTGVPGTGKTMAAQVIAGELGLDLFRIDIAASVSKYIGETAKNLRRIFARAAEMNAVLLFDEADALFSKRTDVRDSHDRYANTDTNYLLQLLEDFDGVALLASNKRQNMDTAFVRRLRYTMDFPKPSARERLLIWKRLLPELAYGSPPEELVQKLPALAEAVELTGAQIKLSLLAAVFAAKRQGAPLALRHLYQGISREIAKEGRTFGPDERRRIERDG